MKNTIPFDLFGEKQEMCFTIGDIRPFERAMGMPIQKIYMTGYAGFDFVLTALPFCLKKLNAHLIEEKVRQYLIAESGRKIDDIAIPIVHAISASGALGKDAMDEALCIYYPEFYQKQESPNA